jgi:hypothetical protein
VRRLLSRLLSAALALGMLITITCSALAQDAVPSGNEIHGHWAQDTLNEWIRLGYLNGDDTGQYRPDAEITRAEFMALVNRVIGYAGESGGIGTYTDVSPGDWYYGDISTALAAGYISGTSGSAMSPAAPITREQAITVIARIKGINPEAAQLDILSETGDSEAISEWAKGYVAGAIDAGYVGGDDGKIRPVSHLTRAEAIVLLDRVRTDSRIYSFPGTYGSDDQVTQANAVLIASPGVTLLNFQVAGDVQIGETIGDGEATLSRVTVGGDLTVNGGGKNTVDVIDVSVTGDVNVNKPGVRLLLSGLFSTGGSVVIMTGAIIDAGQVTGGSPGEFIISPQFSGGSVEFRGSIPLLTNNYPGAVLIFSDASVGTLNLNANAAVTGTGSVALANVGAGAGQGTTLPFAPGRTEGAGAGDVVISGQPPAGGSGGGGGGGGGDPAVTTGTISGTVTDGTSPVKGAAVVVSIDGRDYSAVTNNAGGYSIANVPETSSCTVTASKFAYTDGTAAASVTAGGSATGVNMTLGALHTNFTKVTGVTADTLTFLSGANAGAEGHRDIAVGDYVNYTAAGDVEKAEVVEGQISTLIISDERTMIRIGSISYYPSGETNASDLATYDNDQASDLFFYYDYTLYLDPFGYIIAQDESKTTVSVTSVMLLKSAVESGGGYSVTTGMFGPRSFTLNDEDALSLQAFLACDNEPDADTPVLVKCRIVKDVLTVIGMAAEFTDDITNGTAQIGMDGAETVTADDGTYFYYYSTSDGAWKSYHGIENAPTVDGSLTDAYYLLGNSGVAINVLVITEDPVPPPAHIVAEGYVYYDADML